MRKILIIAPRCLGDCLFAQPLYRQLKNKEPTVQLEAIVTSYTAELHHFIPELDRCYLSPVPPRSMSFFLRKRFGTAFRHAGYAQAYVLGNSFGDALLPFFAQVPRRTGHLGQGRFFILNDRKPSHSMLLPRLIDRYLSLLEPVEPLMKNWSTFMQLTTPSLRTLPEVEKKVAEKYGLTQNTLPLVALCPGSFERLDKRWPSGHFATLAKRLLASKHALLWIGSAQDQSIFQTIWQELDQDGMIARYRKHIYWPRNSSLTEAIYLLKLAQIVVANDSGALHMGAAVGSAVVGLYGPTRLAVAPPSTPRSIALVADPERLYQTDLSKETSPSHPSLIAIDPERVYEAVCSLLKEV